MFDTDFFAKFNQSTQAKSSANDQYAALREVKSSFVQPQPMKEEDKHTSSSEDEDEEDPWQGKPNRNFVIELIILTECNYRFLLI